MCDITHSYVRHASFIRVTCLIHTRDMPHSYVQDDSNESSWSWIKTARELPEGNQPQSLWADCVLLDVRYLFRKKSPVYSAKEHYQRHRPPSPERVREWTA